MSICDRIKKRRNELQMSQQELAELVGYDNRASISRLENGSMELPLGKVEIFAKALRVTPEYLMGWEEEENNTFNELIGERIQHALKNKGYSLYDLSEYLNIPTGETEQILTGQTYAGKATLENIAAYLDTTYYYLIGLDDIATGKPLKPKQKENQRAKVLARDMGDLSDEDFEVIRTIIKRFKESQQ